MLNVAILKKKNKPSDPQPAWSFTDEEVSRWEKEKKRRR